MKGNKVIVACLVIMVIFIVGVVLRLAKPVLFPFFLAVFLSFILSPILDFLTRKKIPRAVSILFIVILAFFIIYLLGILFYSSGKSFASEFPEYGKKISSIITSVQEKIKLALPEWEPEDWVGQLDINRIGGLFLSSLGPFFTFMSNLFLVFIFLIFILAGRGNIKVKVKNSFNSGRASQIIDVIEKIDNQIQKYLAIKTAVSFSTGVFATVVLLIFGVDFAIVFGFFTFILNYIPNIGSIIATALPVAIAVFQFETLWPAFWIFIILGSIQMTLGNFIEPRVMGQSLGLSTLVVLFFLFFWGWLWGIPGMILSVPTAAIIKIVCSNIPSLNFMGELMSKG
ncbi:MAG: AI-2E family transporter [Candidatus Aminicenantes bacterium]|nr:AI-2E family transporter [Candidatus Aminicenantes bacterium]MBL7082348.1 AI-2E family transporter [Candidatus Aminicenantes bacterium]